MQRHLIRKIFGVLRNRKDFVYMVKDISSKKARWYNRELIKQWYGGKEEL